MRIGIIAPARELDRAVAARTAAFAAIAFPEVDLVFHPQCFLSSGHFAGTDDQRATAFLEMANDPAIDALWFGRGGYGSNRILTRVMDALGPAAHAKAYLGYSDTGFLLGALYARRIGRAAPGPMPIDLDRTGGDVPVTRSLAWPAAPDPQGLEGRTRIV